MGQQYPYYGAIKSKEDNFVLYWQVNQYRKTTDSYCPKYRGISANFGNSGQFQCVSLVNLFRAGTRWMSFFFFFFFSFNFFYRIFGNQLNARIPVRSLLTNLRKILAAKFFSSSHDKDHDAPWLQNPYGVQT